MHLNKHLWCTDIVAGSEQAGGGAQWGGSGVCFFCTVGYGVSRAQVGWNKNSVRAHSGQRRRNVHCPDNGVVEKACRADHLCIGLVYVQKLLQLA
jgi:hypothetical protein